MASYQSLLSGLIGLFIFPILLPAQETVGECLSVKGVLLAQTKQGWKSLSPKDAIPQETLLVSLFESELLSKNGAVGLKMLADTGHRTPYPVMEAGLKITNNPQVDVEVHLDRGIVVFTNQKKSGAARVNLVIRNHPIHLELEEPGAKIGVEIYGRHAPGFASLKEDDPSNFVFFLAAKGRIQLATSKKKLVLHAPPGPAILKWNSVDKTVEVENLEKLPDFKLSETEQTAFDHMCKISQQLNGKDSGAVLERLVKEENKQDRIVAITAMGAIDDLNHLIKGLSLSKHADVRDHSILVLRNWLGRGPGQIARLDQFLIKENKYTPNQAKSFLHLLLGFEEAERKAPETHDLLLGYLNHPRQEIRHLGHWHLVRLVPKGKSIPYDPAGLETDRERRIEQWRKLIPSEQALRN